MYIPMIDIMITNKCNLNCKYCFLSDMNNSTNIKKVNIDDDLINDIIENKYNRSFFMFGGEPLIQIDKIDELYNKIDHSKEMTNDKKRKMLNSIKNIITNGTLIHKNLDTIKSHKYRLQISLDGPKEIHDQNRIYKGKEKGSFDDIIKNIEICKENNIEQSVHGVVQKNTIDRLFDVQQTLQDLTFYLNKSCELFQGNLFMIIFEENYEDLDIEHAIEEWIKTQFYIKEEYGFKQMFDILDKDGGDCQIGKSLFQSLPNGDLYPCHRYVGNNKLMNEGFLGNLNSSYKDTPKKSKRLINNFLHFHSNYHLLNIQGNNKHTYICPQTSMETTHSPGMINPKYTQLYFEISKISDLIRNEYKEEYDKYLQKKQQEKGQKINTNIHESNNEYPIF